MGALRTRKNTNLKVIAGLLLPPIIAKLDFKSKEELQLMPQTEEEHLENQNMDYEDHEKLNPDAEVSTSFPYFFDDICLSITFVQQIHLQYLVSIAHLCKNFFEKVDKTKNISCKGTSNCQMIVINV